ncbi:MAG: hypothetical protein ACOCU4_05700 [Alkalispirochaeta sp.]
MKNTKKRTFVLAALAAALVLILSGCGGPISYDEAETATDMISSSRDELSDVQSQLTSAAESDDVDAEELETIADQLGEVEAVLNDVESTIAPPEPPEEGEMESGADPAAQDPAM